MLRRLEELLRFVQPTDVNEILFGLLRRLGVGALLDPHRAQGLPWLAIAPRPVAACCRRLLRRRRLRELLAAQVKRNGLRATDSRLRGRIGGEFGHLCAGVGSHLQEGRLPLGRGLLRFSRTRRCSRPTDTGHVKGSRRRWGRRGKSAAGGGGGVISREHSSIISVR